jgi:hypothetical protein
LRLKLIAELQKYGKRVAITIKKCYRHTIFCFIKPERRVGADGPDEKWVKGPFYGFEARLGGGREVTIARFAPF